MNRAQRRAAERAVSKAKPHGRRHSYDAMTTRNLAIGKAVTTDTDSKDERIVMTGFLMAREKIEQGIGDKADFLRLFEMVTTCHHLGGHLLGAGKTTVEFGRFCLDIHMALRAVSEMTDRLTSTGRVGMTGDQRKAVLRAEEWLDQLVKVASKGMLITALHAAAEDVEQGMRNARTIAN